MRILVIAGTRPEVIKLAALMRLLPDATLCVTGQHREMLNQTMWEFGLEAAIDLNLMQTNQTPAEFIGRALPRLASVVAHEAPDWVVVQGDTATAFAGALAGFLIDTPVAHVEAGLRTGNMRSPFPEEMFRSQIDRLATRNFAPTPSALLKLNSEGLTGDVVGSTALDAIDLVLRDSPGADAPFILATIHRRESFGQALDRIAEGLIRIAAEIPVVLPLHPNPQIRRIESRLRAGGVTIVSPIRYREFVGLMQACSLIVTDSGGIQEEALYLGKPVVVARERTEWIEGVNAGGAALVGSDPEAIVGKALEWLRSPPTFKCPYQAGASTRIVEALCES